jgi:hypothetical protein
MPLTRRAALRAGTAVAVLGAACLPAVAALAAGNPTQATASAFDARGTASPESYCLDVPTVLVGQKICGGVLQSNIIATTDPRGFALAGLAPVPKLSSVPLLIPATVPVIGIPVPAQVQDALKQVKYDNTPSQCQALFPALNDGDEDRTCGGPTGGDAAAGFVASGANAHVQSTGSENDSTQTRTMAESRASDVRLPGLQSTSKAVYASAEGGLNAKGVPTSVSDVKTGEITAVSGLITIRGVRSRTAVSFDGTKANTAVSSTFSYSGASVLGIPVEITKDGLTVATSQVPVAQAAALTAQLNAVLRDNKGFGVELLPAPPIQVQANQVSASSGGILVTYKSANPEATVSMLIGATQAQVAAVPLADESSGAGDSGSGATGGGGGGGGSTGVLGGGGSGGGSTGTDSGVAVAPGLGTGSLPDPGVTVPDPTVAGGETSTGATGTKTTLGNQALLQGFTTKSLLSSSRLRNLYPAFCALLLGSFFLSRFRRRPVFEAQAFSRGD